MAKQLFSFGLLTLAIAIGMSSMFGLTAADGECSNDMTNLATKCLPYVQYPSDPKIPPSNDCCAVVLNCDMQCVCEHVTKEIEKLVCMKKVVYVADACGRPLAKGTKCGSFVVPPV